MERGTEAEQWENTLFKGKLEERSEEGQRWGQRGQRWPSLKVPPSPPRLVSFGAGTLLCPPPIPPFPALPPTLAPIQKCPSFFSALSRRPCSLTLIRIVPKDAGAIDVMISFLLILLALCRAGQARFQRSGKCSIYLFFLANWYQSKKAREKEQEKVEWVPLSSPAPGVALFLHL